MDDVELGNASTRDDCLPSTPLSILSLRTNLFLTSRSRAVSNHANATKRETTGLDSKQTSDRKQPSHLTPPPSRLLTQQGFRQPNIGPAIGIKATGTEIVVGDSIWTETFSNNGLDVALVACVLKRWQSITQKHVRSIICTILWCWLLKYL